MTQNTMTPEELHRLDIYNQIQTARQEAGRLMLRITEINRLVAESDTEEKINSELLYFATELLKTYNDRTERLLSQWESMNP